MYAVHMLAKENIIIYKYVMNYEFNNLNERVQLT